MPLLKSKPIPDEVIKVECLVNLKQAELHLVKSIAGIVRSVTPVIAHIGTSSRLILTGAGVLVAMWGFSKFTVAVLRPFQQASRRDKSLKGMEPEGSMEESRVKP